MNPAFSAVNFYNVLNISPTATSYEIKKARDRCAFKHHSDKKGGSDEMMKVINEAYRVLSDPKLRSQYDEIRDDHDEDLNSDASGFLHVGHKLSDEFKSKINFWKMTGPYNERTKFCHPNAVGSVSLFSTANPVDDHYARLLQSEERSIDNILQAALPEEVWKWSFSKIALPKAEILHSPAWSVELQEEKEDENNFQHISGYAYYRFFYPAMSFSFPDTRALKSAIQELSIGSSPSLFDKTRHLVGEFVLCPKALEEPLGYIPKYKPAVKSIGAKDANSCADCSEAFGIFRWSSDCTLCEKAHCSACLTLQKVPDYSSPVDVCRCCDKAAKDAVKKAWLEPLDKSGLREKLTGNYLALVDEFGYASRKDFLAWRELFFKEERYDLAIQCNYSGNGDWLAFAETFIKEGLYGWAKCCLHQIRHKDRNWWIEQADAFAEKNGEAAILLYQHAGGLTLIECEARILKFTGREIRKNLLPVCSEKRSQEFLKALCLKLILRNEIALACSYMGVWMLGQDSDIKDAVEFINAVNIKNTQGIKRLVREFAHHYCFVNWPAMVHFKADRDHYRLDYMQLSMSGWLEYLIERLQKGPNDELILYFRSKMRGEDFMSHRDHFLSLGEYAKMAICHRLIPNRISWEELSQKWRSKDENGSLAADLCDSIDISKKGHQLFAARRYSLALRYYLQAGNYQAIKEKSMLVDSPTRLLYQVALWRSQPDNLSFVLDIAKNLFASRLDAKHAQSLAIAILKRTNSLLEGMPSFKLLIETDLSDQELLGVLDTLSGIPPEWLNPQDRMWYSKTVLSFQTKFKNKLRQAIYQYAFEDVFALTALIQPLTQAAVHAVLAELKFNELPRGTVKSLCLLLRSMSHLVPLSRSGLFAAMNDITEAILGTPDDACLQLCAQALEKIAAHASGKLRGQEVTHLEPPLPNEFTARLARSPDLKMLMRADSAIAKLKPLEAAMSYIDLSMAARHAPGLVGCFLNAAFALAKEQQQVATSARIVAMRDIGLEREAYAYRRAVGELIATAYTLGNACLCPATQLYMLRSGIAILTAVFESSPTISSQEQMMLEELQVEMDRLVKVAPMVMERLLQTYDLVYLDVVNRKFMSVYLNHMRSSPQQSNPIYQYYLFEGTWKGWIDEEQFTFDTERKRTMQALLEEKHQTMQDVADLMSWPMLDRDADGWLLDKPTALNLNGQTFTKVQGVRFNLDTGEVDLLLDSSSDPMEALFDMDDVQDVLQRGITGAQFTLDPPDSNLPDHPFQEMLYAPKNLAGTNYLGTLLHADLLLKMLSMKTEISSKPPFALRDAKENLLKRMPEELRRKFTKLDKKLSERTNRINRFWIEAEELLYYTQESKSANVVTYTFGKCTMVVNKHLMRRNSEGKLVDTDEDTDTTSAEAKFAKLMTKNYAQLGRHFRELARLEELVKLQAISNFMQSTHRKVQKIHSKIDKPLEKIRDEVNSLVDRLNFVYPQNNPQNIEAQLSKLLRQNHLTRSQLSQQALAECRNNISNQLDQADESNFYQMHEILCQMYHATDIKWQLSEWLDNGNSDILKNTLKYHWEAHHKQKILQICETFKHMHVAIDPPSESECSGCRWVPAAFRKDANYRVYGGVNMNARLVNGGLGGGRAANDPHAYAPKQTVWGGPITSYQYVVRTDSGGKIYGTTTCVDRVTGNTYTAHQLGANIKDQWNNHSSDTRYAWKSYLNPKIEHYTSHYSSNSVHLHDLSGKFADCIDEKGNRTRYNKGEGHKCNRY